MSPAIGCAKVELDVPVGIEEPPLTGARVPNVSLQVPGLVVAKRNHAVAASPPGLTTPFSVAVVPVRLLALPVDTVGKAGKVVKETAYHLRHATAWVVRLGDGTDESHRRMQTAIDALWMYTGEMFQSDAVDEVLEAQGTASDVAGLREPWLAQLRHTLGEATLKLPAPDAWMQKGGKQG